MGACAVATTADDALYVYDDTGAEIARSATGAHCQWVDIAVSGGRTYTIKTVARAGTGTYRVAWSVNGARVIWNVSGRIDAEGARQYVSFPILQAGPLMLSSCGPSNANFDLYLDDASRNTLASSTSPSTCESLSYTPGARGLYRLREMSASGTGAWSGTISTS